MIYNFCGIDEAGRGPIAGDLVMAGCVLHNMVDGLNDSKKLTPKRREALYELIIKNASFHIVKFSAKDIDEFGISLCITRGLREIIKMLPCKSYLFDGNSKFGVHEIETMVKADGKIPEVSAASILAKVTHDKDIIELAKEYPLYQLEKHKGYGTALHVEMIKRYGYSEIHRKTYKLKALNKIVTPSLF